MAEAEKKEKGLSRIAKRTGKWFREMKAEFKKIVWPTPKQVAKDTAIVLAMVVVVGVLVWALSLFFHWGVGLIVGA